MKLPLLPVCVLLITVSACSKSSSSPTAPTPEPTTIATISAPTRSQQPAIASARIDGLTHTLTLEWDAVPQATGYVLEVATANQPTTTIELTETRYDLSTPGRLCLAVRAKNSAGLSPSTSCRQVVIVDMRNVIEALFFNDGPYGETEGGAQRRLTQMLGWPSGATVPVVVGSNVPSVQHAIVSRVTEQFVRTTGIYNMPVIPSPNIEPPRLDIGRIRVINPPAEERARWCPDFGTRVLEGCAPYRTANSTIEAAMVVLWANTAYLAGHEIGHNFGLFHVLLPSGSAPPTGTPGLLMQTPRPQPEPSELSPIELEAIRLVYSNGFRNRTPKQDFITRGLIHAR